MVMATREPETEEMGQPHVDTTPHNMSQVKRGEVLTREQVLEEMAGEANLRSRDVDHNPNTRIIIGGDNGMVFRPGAGQHSMELAPEGVASLNKFAGIPEHMKDHISPSTMERVATEILSHKERYTVLTRDGQVVDFVKRGVYRNVPPERVVDTIERAIPVHTYARVLNLPGHIVSLDVVGQDEQPVSRGDLVQAGANIVFSPIGTVAPMVKSYILQLACLNGNVSNRIVREFHFGGEGDNMWHFFRKATREAYRALGGIITGWQHLLEEHIPEGQRAERLEAMLKESHITDKYAATVRAWAVETPPRNEYDLMNLITRASTHLLEEPKEILRSREAAAAFAAAPHAHRACPVCHRGR